MKLCYRLVCFLTLAAVIFLAGCNSNAPSLRCAYKVGDVDTVKYSTETQYKTWVKMPDKEPTKPDKRQTNKEIVVTRTVEEVDSEGVATMNIEFKSVKLAIDTDVRDEPKHKEYNNNDDSFVSDWPKEAKLVGKSYKIRIAPDTSIIEIIGLEELTQQVRNELKLKPADEFSGVVASILDPDDIKTMHEREFIKFAPAKLSLKAPYEKTVPIPDSMIKAKAIRKIFTPTVNQDGMINVISTIEPLYTLPEGMEEPEQPNNFGQSLIKDKSDMQELTIANVGQFDSKTGKLKSEVIKMNCMLILDGDSLGFGNQNKKTPKGSGGEMFTTIDSVSSYVVE